MFEEILFSVIALFQICAPLPTAAGRVSADDQMSIQAAVKVRITELNESERRLPWSEATKWQLLADDVWLFAPNAAIVHASLTRYGSVFIKQSRLMRLLVRKRSGQWRIERELDTQCGEQPRILNRHL